MKKTESTETNHSERTITELSEMKGKTAVYFSDTETCRLFLEEAEKEGFTFGDGIKPTLKQCVNILIIHSDKTISYPGFTGHMAFMNPGGVIGGLNRIDYRKYINGKEDYLYSIDN